MPATPRALPVESPAVVPPDARIAATRIVALGCTLGLVLLGLGWELGWARIGQGTLAIKVLPLVAALPGLWHWRLYTCRWLSLVVWLYVAEAAVRGASEGGLVRALAGVELVLSVVLFAACAAQVRWRLRAGREAASTSASAGAGDGSDAGPSRP